MAARRSVGLIVLGSIAAALCALGALWLSYERHASTAAVPVDAKRVLEAPSDTATPQALDAPRSDGEPAREEIAAAAESTKGRGQAAQGPVEGVLVLAVEHGTDHPVAGAEVFYAHSSDVRSRLDLLNQPDEWSNPSLLTEVGQRATTDAAGQARLPVSKENWLTLVRKGDLWGWRTLRPTASSPAKIELFTDRTLRVQVLDAANRLVPDIWVALRTKAGIEDLDQWTAKTRADDGMATFEHADVLLSPYYGRASFEVAAEVLARETVGADVDLDPWPSAPIRLQLPPTGSIVVELLDDAGAVFSGDFSTWFVIPSAADTQAWNPSTAFRAGKQGIARLERVALGLEVELRVLVAGRQMEFHRALGPTLAAEEVRVRVPLSRREQVLSGRLVDQDRRPLAELAIRVVCRRTNPDGSGTSNIGNLRTDGDGLFQIVAPSGDLRPDAVADLYVRSSDESEHPGLEAHPTLPALLVPGDNDLGDVPMLEAPPLLAGRVIDDTGKPLEHAWLSPRVEFESQGGNRTQIKLPERAESRADGTFVLRGARPVSDIDLQVDCFGFIPLYAEGFAPGSTGVEIVMQRAAMLAGRIVCDPGVAVQQIELSAITIDPPDESPGNNTIHPAEDGRFEFPALHAGTTTIRATLPGEEAPLAMIDDVRTIAGQSVRDARLDPLDLRGVLHAIDIEVVGEDGAAITDGWARVIAAEPNSNSHGEAIADGRVQLVMRGESADVEVWSPGYMLAQLHGARGSQRVVLRRAMLVRLELDPAVELPPAGTTLYVNLVPCDQSGHAGRFALPFTSKPQGASGTDARPMPKAEAFGPSRAVTCLAIASGKNEVHFMLRREESGGGERSYWSLARQDCRVIDVSAANSETVSRVAPEPIGYQRALSEMGKK